MKLSTFITLLFLSMALISSAQPLKGSADSTENKLCKERRHQLTGAVVTSLMYCPDYIIDTDSTTVLVSPGCNSSWGVCERCNQKVGFNGKETRRIIWKIKPKKQKQ